MMSSMKMTSELKVKGSLGVGKGGKWEAVKGFGRVQEKGLEG